MALDGFLVRRSSMSLRLPQPVPPVPADTGRIARAAFPRGNPYLLLRDRLGPVFDDAGFADLYPRRGQPAYTPWRLALVTLLQFREGLSDRQAAEAVRARIDWKYRFCQGSRHRLWPTRVRLGIGPPLTKGVDEDAVLGMRVGGGNRASRAHRPGLPPVPL